VELLENLVLMGPLRRFLVKSHKVRNHLRVLSLGILGNATFVDETLPFFRQTRELACRAVVSDVCDLYRILWR
jgi:hypothetical protein